MDRESGRVAVQVARSAVKTIPTRLSLARANLKPIEATRIGDLCNDRLLMGEKDDPAV